VVWVDNRETPLTTATGGSGSSVSAPAALAVTNTSNLVLSDADGRVVWATNVVADTPAGNGGTVATLTNEGCLVLRSPDGTTLWQSFDHPTDSFIPGMKFRFRMTSGGGDRLVSWKSPSDPSPGSFTYGLDQVGNGSRPLWRSTVWTGYRSSIHYMANISAHVYLGVNAGDGEIYMGFSVSDGVSRARYVMSYTGKLRVQSWNNASLRWDELIAWPPNECSRYGYCGPFGYCDNTDGGGAAAAAVPACKCLDGFEPTSSEDWSRGNFSRGCRRRQALTCGGDGDRFLGAPGHESAGRVRARQEQEPRRVRGGVQRQLLLRGLRVCQPEHQHHQWGFHQVSAVGRGAHRRREDWGR